MCWHLFVHVCSHFIFRVSSLHASPDSFLCYLFFFLSFLIFPCLFCLLHSSWLSSAAVLPFHSLSLTVDCILSPSCLLPMSLFIPSSHLSCESCHLLLPLLFGKNTYWGFPAPNCQAPIAVCCFGRNNSHSAGSPRQMVGLMACQSIKSGWKFKVHRFRATKKRIHCHQSPFKWVNPFLPFWACSPLIFPAVYQPGVQIITPECLPFFIKADIYGDALQYFWLPFMGFGTLTQCWCICLHRCLLSVKPKALIVNYLLRVTLLHRRPNMSKKTWKGHYSNTFRNTLITSWRKLRREDRCDYNLVIMLDSDKVSLVHQNWQLAEVSEW